MKTLPHIWKWREHGERYYFGDFNKPYCVDYWICIFCKKEIQISGNKNPKPGKCRRNNGKQDTK